jgi:hypothetical protein
VLAPLPLPDELPPEVGRGIPVIPVDPADPPRV